MKSHNLPVSILLATLNGAAHLREQLESIQAQDHKDWHIILSDDGSIDETLNIATSTIEADRLTILRGPQKGLTQNFWNALMHVPEGYFAAFCDQDDVWNTDKLSNALLHIGKSTDPTLFSAGRVVTDETLHALYCQSRRSVRSFTGLLWRNRITGHTCMINPEAVQILKKFPPPIGIPFHDWWAALVLKGVGAEFVHDPEPSLYYRQHTSNVLGAQGGRIRKILNGTYVGWVHANYVALRQVQDQFRLEAQHALHVCLPRRAELSLRQRKLRLDHARQHQQQTRRRGIFD